MSPKPIVWQGSSLVDLRAFPQNARRRAGRALDMVQNGEDPPDWKPMSAVGPGVREIRIKVGRQFRVLYVAQFAEAIHVLHVFEKKTQRTLKSDVDLARRRLASVRRDRSFHSR
jgi:phage-related protein